jgi:hypothetical protein
VPYGNVIHILYLCPQYSSANLDMLQPLNRESSIQFRLGKYSYLYIYVFWGGGWEWAHLVRRPLIGLLYQPQMIDEMSVEHPVGWELAGETEVLGENLP